MLKYSCTVTQITTIHRSNPNKNLLECFFSTRNRKKAWVCSFYLISSFLQCVMGLWFFSISFIMTAICRTYPFKSDAEILIAGNWSSCQGSKRYQGWAIKAERSNLSDQGWAIEAEWLRLSDQGWAIKAERSRLSDQGWSIKAWWSRLSDQGWAIKAERSRLIYQGWR